MLVIKESSKLLRLMDLICTSKGKARARVVNCKTKTSGIRNVWLFSRLYPPCFKLCETTLQGQFEHVMEGGFVYRNDDGPIHIAYPSVPVGPLVLSGGMEWGFCLS